MSPRRTAAETPSGEKEEHAEVGNRHGQALVNASRRAQKASGRAYNSNSFPRRATRRSEGPEP